MILGAGTLPGEKNPTWVGPKRTDPTGARPGRASPRSRRCADDNRRRSPYLSFDDRPVYGLVHVPFDFERVPGERHHGLQVQARLFRADAVQYLVQHLFVQLVDLKHESCDGSRDVAGRRQTGEVAARPTERA